MLTLVAMAPVGEAIASRAAPLVAAAQGRGRTGTPTPWRWCARGIDAVREPMRDFLKANASEKERERFFDVARRARHEAAERGRRSGRTTSRCSCRRSS